MMGTLWRLGVLLGASSFLIASGCSGGGGPSMDEVPAEIAGATCSQLEQCLPGFFLQAFFQGADCTERQTKRLEDQELPRWKAAMDDGKMSYKPGKVDDCVQAIEDAGCGILVQRLPDACNEMLQGKVEPGDDCYSDVECTGDHVCRFSSQSCPGTCGTRKSEGGGCESDEDCQSGLMCSGATCVDPAAEGESCNESRGVPCQAPNLCLGASAGMDGTCRAPEEAFQVSEGESCAPGSGMLCNEGLSCTLRDASASGAEWQCASTAESGGTCYIGIPGHCPDGEYCAGVSPRMGQFEGTCEALPGEGEACRTNDMGQVQNPACAPGLVCADGQCVMPKRLGESCEADAGCFSGNCEEGTCTELLCPVG